MANWISMTTSFSENVKKLLELRRELNSKKLIIFYHRCQTVCLLSYDQTLYAACLVSVQCQFDFRALFLRICVGLPMDHVLEVQLLNQRHFGQ